MKEKTVIWFRLGLAALAVATLGVIGCGGVGTPTSMGRAKGCVEKQVPRSPGGSEDSWEEIRTNAVPLRVGVYVDAGTSGVETFRWLQFVSTPWEIEVRCLDGERLRKDALEEVDLLVVPGTDVAAIAKSMGTEGCAKVKAFVARGGSFIGSGAGCALALQGGSGMALVPFKDVPADERHGVAEVKVKFEAEGKTILLKSESRSLLCANGPIMVPGDPVAEAAVKVVARYDGDFAVDGAKPLPSMAGKAAMVAGRYGKGNVFLSAVHPEDLVANWDIVRPLFAWCGRTWATRKKPAYRSYPHERGNLQVGIVAAGCYGVETGDILVKLARLSGVDLRPVDADRVRHGVLRKLDAVVFGATGAGDMLKAEDVRAKFTEFLKAGGLAVAWGNGAAGLEGVEDFADFSMAIERLFACKLETVAQPPAATVEAAKSAKRKRAAVYLGGGGGSVLEARLLEWSPEYEVFYVDGPAIAAGALKDADILIQGGGSGEAQFKALGEKGQANLRKFILEGGGYHGTCAGAFLMIEPTRRVRMNMVPYRPDDPDHYRGGADTLLKATEAGKSVFGPRDTYRVCYHGGAVMVPGKPVEGADFKVFLEYEGNMINTDHPEKMLPMTGKAAMVGGTCGKGRVVLCGPHPEVDEGTDELFLKSVGWVTGVVPHPKRPWHRPERPEIGFKSGYTAVEGGLLSSMLGKEPEVNFPAVGINSSDVLVLSNPKAEDFKLFTRKLAEQGRLVVLANHPESIKIIPADLKGAVICKTAEEAMVAVRKCLELFDDWKPENEDEKEKPEEKK